MSKLSTTTDDSYDQSDADPMSDEEKQRLKEEAKKLRLSGQNPDEVPEGDFLSEAKVTTDADAAVGRHSYNCLRW